MSSTFMHFFKVMIGDFHTKLSIPPGFYSKLNGEKLMEKAILRSYMGSWDVEIDKCGPLFHFKKGWEEFARNHDLYVGDFLVFKHKGNMRFDVLVFDSSACEKRVSDESAGNKRARTAGHHMKHIKLESDSVVSQKRLPQPMAQGKNKPHDRISTVKQSQKLVAASSASRRPYFTVTLIPSNCNRRNPYLNVPREFWRYHSNDIVTEQRIIGLRDSVNMIWPVKLKIRIRSRNKQQLMLGLGWHKFYESNKLKIGDVCVFELSTFSPEIPYPVLDVRTLPAEK